jgi:DNA-binding PadR family transcriptional regulator
MFWTTSESHYYAEPKRLAKLGYLSARPEPGRTRARTGYALTDQGREALRAWLAQPAAMPRVQHEALVKLLAADFSDDATIVASLAGLRDGINDAYASLKVLTERAEQIPHRTRYLRLINDFGQRSLDTLSAWLDHVEHELAAPADSEPPPP